VRFAGDSVLSPRGDKLIFLLDHRHDGYLRFHHQKRSVNDFADPWTKNGYNGEKHFNYKTAVGIVAPGKPGLRNDQTTSQLVAIVPLNDTDYKFYFRDAKTGSEPTSKAQQP
jgi:hypothetical protein